MNKRLYRSRDDKMLFGVCGGIADYFDIDPTWIRLGFVLLLLSGTGFFAYIIAAIIIPEKPIAAEKAANQPEKPAAPAPEPQQSETPVKETAPDEATEDVPVNEASEEEKTEKVEDADITIE